MLDIAVASSRETRVVLLRAIIALLVINDEPLQFVTETVTSYAPPLAYVCWMKPVPVRDAVEPSPKFQLTTSFG